MRVPFYLSYPAKYEGNKEIETTAAHIDILPTLAEICNAEPPTDRIIDGESLVPLLNGNAVNWSDRSLFFYWTRRFPELYNNIALQKDKFKLVGQTGYNSSIGDFDLFDIKRDPYEQKNIVADNKDIAISLKNELDRIYKELISSENTVNPPFIEIGNPHENPVYPNRNDAGGERGIWAQEEIYGTWRVHIQKGTYDVAFKFVKPVDGNGIINLETGAIINQTKVESKPTDIIEMKDVPLPELSCDLIPFYIVGNKRIFPFWVRLERTDM